MNSTTCWRPITEQWPNGKPTLWRQRRCTWQFVESKTHDMLLNSLNYSYIYQLYFSKADNARAYWFTSCLCLCPVGQIHALWWDPRPGGASGYQHVHERMEGWPGGQHPNHAQTMWPGTKGAYLLRVWHLVDGLIMSKLTHLMRLSDGDGKYFVGTAS